MITYPVFNVGDLVEVRSKSFIVVQPLRYVLKSTARNMLHVGEAYVTLLGSDGTVLHVIEKAMLDIKHIVIIDECIR